MGVVTRAQCLLVDDILLFSKVENGFQFLNQNRIVSVDAVTQRRRHPGLDWAALVLVLTLQTTGVWSWGGGSLVHCPDTAWREYTPFIQSALFFVSYHLDIP